MPVKCKHNVMLMKIWKSKDYFCLFCRKDYCFSKGLYSTIPEDYSFDGRLDFQDNSLYRLEILS